MQQKHPILISSYGHATLHYLAKTLSGWLMTVVLIRRTLPFVFLSPFKIYTTSQLQFIFRNFLACVLILIVIWYSYTIANIYSYYVLKSRYIYYDVNNAKRLEGVVAFIEHLSLQSPLVSVYKIWCCSKIYFTHCFCWV